MARLYNVGGLAYWELQLRSDPKSEEWLFFTLRLMRSTDGSQVTAVGSPDMLYFFDFIVPEVPGLVRSMRDVAEGRTEAFVFEPADVSTLRIMGTRAPTSTHVVFDVWCSDFELGIEGTCWPEGIEIGARIRTTSEAVLRFCDELFVEYRSVTRTN